MVCFLACFGLTKKQRRRKPRNKTQPTHQVEGRYVPLDSGKPEEPDSETRNDGSVSKESLAVKVKKKVRFNLDVKTYEPLHQEEIEDDEEKPEWEYPSDYRYYNCRESFDEEDEIELEESDLEDDDDIDDYDGDDEDYTRDDNEAQAEVSEKFTKTENTDAVSGGDDEPKSRVLVSDSCESNRNTRNRSQYVNSVLNPVENLTQWKAVKAREQRERTQVKNQKENIRLEQEDHKPAIAKSPSDPLSLSNNKHNVSDLQVDASLSNWLLWSENKPPSGAVSLQKWASC
ncbi:PREDICTED: nuclear polyadenylated RNA-binding protein 3-like [Ipomoea nil]|uniref:nuclear polyadenylated RNA-binding protein 3-like n=1 Tax=Ipomoea nil TaxID=35883 RepID=UPI000901D88F|nr:PREDICTED: nuclear polyadenylated RNA-binding protein 3-like [Ipomoea nil]